MNKARASPVVYRSFKCLECHKLVKVTHSDDIRRNFCSYTCRVLYCYKHGMKV